MIQNFTVGLQLNRNKTKKSGETPIYLKISLERRYFENSMRRSVAPEDWDVSAQHVPSKTCIPKSQTVAKLAKAAYDLFEENNVHRQIEPMNNFPGTMLTESQFAQIIGRVQMYRNMSFRDKKELPTSAF